MKAYEIGGKRRGGGVLQDALAARLGCTEHGLRDVERGDIEISEEFFVRINTLLDIMISEKQKKNETDAAGLA